MGKLLWISIGLSMITIFFLLAALIAYDEYSGMLRNLKECENQANSVPDENSRGQSLYYCGKVFGYSYRSQDQVGNTFVIISGIAAAITATLFAANYRPSWFGWTKKVSAS